MGDQVTVPTAATYKKILDEMMRDFDSGRAGFGGDGEPVDLDMIYEIFVERATEEERDDA